MAFSVGYVPYRLVLMERMFDWGFELDNFFDDTNRFSKK